MKALISGHSGFIGQNLSEHLAKAGFEVTGISRELLGNTLSLEDFIFSEKPDVICHLAAYGNHGTQTEEAEIWEANVNKTQRLLTASRNYPYKAFINISTLSVILPVQTAYSKTKLLGEKIAASYASVYDKPIVTVRLPSVYGPGETLDFGRFIPTISTQIAKGDQIKISEGAHDWTYVDDVSTAIIEVVRNARLLKGKSVDIGTGEARSNQEVADILMEIAGKKVEVDKVEGKAYDTKDWSADPTLIKSLGWQPYYGINKGLKLTYDYYALH